MRRSAPPSPARPETAGPEHLSNVQILRGIAALMVLVYHIGNEFADRGLADAVPAVEAGSAGVDIFFVVSGFIMVHSTAGAFGARGAPLLFLMRRAVRLVPLYWLVTSVFAATLVWRTHGTGLPGGTWRWIAASYGFLFYARAGDGDDFPLYAQGWTLNFEMFFYACFAAVLPMRRGVALFGLAAGLLLLAALGAVVALPWPLDRWSNSNVIEFVLGLGLAEIYARGWRLPLAAAVPLAAAGATVFPLTVASADDWLPYRGLVWGPPALAIVAAAALCRPRRAGPVRAKLEALGDASYALYLVHYAFLVALGGAIELFVPVARVPLAAYGALCFLGAILLGFATHRFLERPINRKLDRALGLARRWRALVDRSTARP